MQTTTGQTLSTKKDENKNNKYKHKTITKQEITTFGKKHTQTIKQEQRHWTET